MIKISKHLLWIEKYLKHAKKRMPSLILPRQVRSYKPPLRKEQWTFGTCAMKERVITLATHRIITVQGVKRKKHKRIALSQKEILMTLAHELAHLRFDPHNYEQESYAHIIFQAFGLKMRCSTCKGTGLVPVKYVN